MGSSCCDSWMRPARSLARRRCSGNTPSGSLAARKAQRAGVERGCGGHNRGLPKRKKATLSLFPFLCSLLDSCLSHSELEPQTALALPLLVTSSQKPILALGCMDRDLMRVDEGICPLWLPP